MIGHLGTLFKADNSRAAEYPDRYMESQADWDD